MENYITYGTFEEISEVILQKQFDIREKALEILDRNFKSLKIQDEVARKRREANKTRKAILIIDEVDVFFSKSFYGKEFKPVALYQNEQIIFLIKQIYTYGKLDP